MSKPRASDLQTLRKIGRYLVRKPRLIYAISMERNPDRIVAFTDIGWAGCARSAKSTSGGDDLFRETWFENVLQAIGSNCPEFSGG